MAAEQPEEMNSEQRSPQIAIKMQEEKQRTPKILSETCSSPVQSLKLSHCIFVMHLGEATN